jgi:hypothetical protein
MKKSYHSMVVPTRLAPTTRRIGDVVAGGGLVAVIVRVSLRGAKRVDIGRPRREQVAALP